MLFFAVLFLANAERTGVSSPVAKVVILLHDLSTQVQTEGTEEAATYDTFACFCKDTTDTKVSEIAEKETSVETLSADAAQLSATANELKADNGQLNTEIDQLNADLKEAIEIRDKEHADYTVTYADLHKAVDSLERAITELQGSQMSLSQVKAMIQPALMFADAMSLLPETTRMSKTVTNLLEDAPEGAPEMEDQDFTFHSGDIIGTLDGLLTTFKNKKETAENEEQAAADAFSTAAGAKRDEISTSTETLTTKEGQLSSAESDLATTTEDLTETTALLHDDRTYLKELTEQCERKALSWDQRSTMRTKELSAIATAIEIIEGAVAGKAESTGAGGRSDAEGALLEEPAQDELAEAEREEGIEPMQFAQLKAVRHVATADSDAMKPRNRIISMLKVKGDKLKSVVLTAIAMKLAADPFAKVKTLIQGLIERLLSESADEATQKGWCDTELGKAKHSRDSRHGDTESLTAEIGALEAHKSKLEDEKVTLTTDLTELRESLQTAVDNRAQEKLNNEKTTKDANEGLTALNQAIKILSDFYKEGAGAFVQQSPVEEDMAAAGAGGPSGSYQGNQAQGTGIIGMLETIRSDFDRTIAETEAAEDQSYKDFTAFNKETSVSIVTKETGLDQTESDHTQTVGDLVSTLEDLKQQQALLDRALETLEKLRPACIDTGMSYEERVERREAEIAALKNALDILSEEDGFLQMKK